jgi:hypothetical protein
MVTIIGIIVLGMSCAPPQQTSIKQGGASNGISKSPANYSVKMNAEPNANRTSSAIAESNLGKLKAQDPRHLCNRIRQIKIFPLKGDRGVDKLYDAFRDAGDSVIPCLIGKITDSTIIRNPVEAPSWGFPTRIGDIAYFLILDTTDLPINELLPDDAKEEYKKIGVGAYYRYIQEPSHRKQLQDKLEAWYQTQYRKSHPIER